MGGGNDHRGHLFFCLRQLWGFGCPKIGGNVDKNLHKNHKIDINAGKTSKDLIFCLFESLNAN